MRVGQLVCCLELALGAEGSRRGQRPNGLGEMKPAFSRDESRASGRQLAHLTHPFAESERTRDDASVIKALSDWGL